jgi:hypothetical protein
MAKNIDVSIDKELEGQGKEILKEVKLISFQASPETIEPFEEVQLSWEVKGPENKFSVRLNNATVAPTGSATVNPVSTTQYELRALALLASKSLGRVTVVVNRDNCFQGAIGQGQIQSEVQNQLTSLIQPGAEIEVREPASVQVDAGRIDIDLPLKIDIKNFFDADLDMRLKFSIGLTPARRVRARLTDVDADAKFHILEHILSLGSASAIQAIVQEVARAFVKSFLGPQLERNLATSLQDAIATLCELAGRTDDRILSISASNGQVEFECCGFSQQAKFTDVLQFTAVLT